MNVSKKFWDGERKVVFEIRQGSLFFKTSEKKVKSGCFEKYLQWRVSTFFEMKEAYKVSCVKILMFF